MKKCIRVISIRALIILIISAFSAVAYGQETFSSKPLMNKGKKWRIGYLEGGPYKDYLDTLEATVKGFMALGWVATKTLPEIPESENTGKLWQWMATSLESTYIEFVPDGYWSSDWDDAQRMKTQSVVLQRLNDKHDIELMIAMGTWAGQDLANNRHDTPTVVLSSSDPVASKIITNPRDSGFDHVHARCDPKRYENQIRMFHRIVGFKKLGVAYEDTLAGRGYAALDSIEKVAREMKFKIVRCKCKLDIPDVKKRLANIVGCHTELASQIDALYLTESNIALQNLPQVLAPLMKAKIPTFSQNGSDEVKHGVLLSIAQADFKPVGKFHAETIAKIFNGAKPRQLPQVFQESPKIAINLKVAQLINWDPPMDIFDIADEIYKEIQIVEREK